MVSLFVLNMKLNQINGPIEPYLKSIIMSLLLIKSSIRIQCKKNVLNALLAPGGSKLAALLLNETSNFLECNVLIQIY